MAELISPTVGTTSIVAGTNRAVRPERTKRFRPVIFVYQFLYFAHLANAKNHKFHILLRSFKNLSSCVSSHFTI